MHGEAEPNPGPKTGLVRKNDISTNSTPTKIAWCRGRELVSQESTGFLAATFTWSSYYEVQLQKYIFIKRDCPFLKDNHFNAQVLVRQGSPTSKENYVKFTSLRKENKPEP